ncbi:Endonuclease-reverse transcriptase [Popillia japonica]|uniref:Endonuclease-reverse transcriptase n=1 Tax=Popillia japonica TaxID=7064 RepID=A0AAW1LAD9_POPJA
MESNFILDNKNNVAMYIRNKNLGICGHTKGNGYVCLKWKSWCLLGCYCSPNVDLQEFGSFVGSITSELRSTNLEAVIAGDFNAKASMWGSPVTDARGEYLMEWAAELDLSAINWSQMLAANI